MLSSSLRGETSPLTGDREAKDVTVGDRAISGCINVSSPIRVKVVSDFSRSAASRILETVEESSERKSDQENLLSRFEKIYTPSVIAIALILAVVPSLITGNWIEWPGRALAFLILACLSAVDGNDGKLLETAYIDLCDSICAEFEVLSAAFLNIFKIYLNIG